MPQGGHRLQRNRQPETPSTAPLELPQTGSWDAAKNARDFRITDLAGGGRRFEFFSPARNTGYGKLYVQEVDGTGAIIREFKNTLGRDGLIETKWLHGGP